MEKKLKLHSIVGFTLIEILLVLVIISMFLYMGIGYVQQRTLSMSIDRTSLQMQQILNSAMSYYVVNGTWPCTAGSTTALVGSKLQPNYIPSGTYNNPWGNPYTIGCTVGVAAPNPNPVPANFYVYTQLPSGLNGLAGIAQTIVGKLPLAYTTTTTAAVPPASKACAAGSSCYVVASVNVPGQNLNNATAFNFGGLYHHGACVPVPQCPVDANGNMMTPQIFVVPTSVSGLNDVANVGTTNSYPITSFTAYALGGTNTTPAACATRSTSYSAPSYNSGPSSCTTDATGSANAYWRVCLQIITEKGDITATNVFSDTDYALWGQYVTLLAITRCAVANEPSGSTFQVFSN